MTHTARPSFVVTFVAAAVITLASWATAAQGTAKPSPAPPVPAPQVQPPPAFQVDADAADAQRTRERFYQLLEKYPPALGRVLKLDPALMASDAYLAPYPALVAFLAQHPEIARNPAYFLERVSASGALGYSQDPRAMQREEFYGMLGGLAAFMVFLVVTGVIVWLIRMVIDYRKWNRVSKAQFELHGKLLDRFASNEDLLAYIRTPAGARFLESAPVPPIDESRPMGAPFSRIIWSVQAGIVLGIAGVALLFLSWRLIEEASQFFFVAGTVTLALGGGFIFSGAAAYVLSRRLGLLDRPASDHA